MSIYRPCYQFLNLVCIAQSTRSILHPTPLSLDGRDMQKCSLHSKVALLFTRKLVQEQTDQWKGEGGDRASEFPLHGQKHRKVFHSQMYRNACDVEANKNEVSLLGCSYFWCYVNQSSCTVHYWRMGFQVFNLENDATCVHSKTRD